MLVSEHTTLTPAKPVVIRLFFFVSLSSALFFSQFSVAFFYSDVNVCMHWFLVFVDIIYASGIGLNL